MDAAPSSALGVSDELARVPRVAAAENADKVTPDRGVLMGLFFLAAEAATSRRGVLLTFAMELMMVEETIRK